MKPFDNDGTLSGQFVQGLVVAGSRWAALVAEGDRDPLVRLWTRDLGVVALAQLFGFAAARARAGGVVGSDGSADGEPTCAASLEEARAGEVSELAIGSIAPVG